MHVAPCSTLHRLGVLCNVSAASICLAQSYYQRLVLAMPALQSALFLLSTSPSPHSQAGHRPCCFAAAAAAAAA
jgi:hypothetical protein